MVYKEKEAADAACEKLNGGKLKDFAHRSVKVIPSNAKNKLFVGAIPNDMKQEEVEEAFKAEVQGGWTLQGWCLADDVLLVEDWSECASVDVLLGSVLCSTAVLHAW